MRTKLISLLATLAVLVVLPATAGASQPRPNHVYGEMVDYPMIFPVADGADYTFMYGDWFYAARADGDHHAQDIMAPKMTPVIAPVAGTIGYVNWSWTPDDLNPERCCTLTLNHDDGWETWYIHLNNDTPGTDDGLAWGIAPGIAVGVHVEAGQLLGWVGDSGNAEGTAPHLHFELRDPYGTIVNPYDALLAATHITLGEVPEPPGTEPPPEPQSDVYCQGELATIVGTDGDDELVGGDSDDVIHGLHGNDVIHGGGGDDIICGGPGNDEITGGTGSDKIKGHAGDDDLYGDDGPAKPYGGTPGNDIIGGGQGNDFVDGGAGDDLVKGNGGADDLKGGDGDDVLYGGAAGDRLWPGNGSDEAYGGGGGDRLFSAPGVNYLKGGSGKDVVEYASASIGAYVDLANGSGRADGLEALHTIEKVFGSFFDDVLRGDERNNVIKGRGGDDTLEGSAGNDKLVGGSGFDDLLGGEGDDWCSGDTLTDCELGPL